MEIKEFIQNFAEQFEDTDASVSPPRPYSTIWMSGVH